MAGQQTLDLFVEVRILCPQLKKTHTMGFFHKKNEQDHFFREVVETNWMTKNVINAATDDARKVIL